jgi:UDP-N-acetylglucosamine/UDP-N-acetylgalactosamine diphosphorylase
MNPTGGLRGGKAAGYALTRHLMDALMLSWADVRAGYFAVSAADEWGLTRGAPSFYAVEEGSAAAELTAMHAEWVAAAGGEAPEGSLEVSPLVSYAGEGLEGLVAGRSFRAAFEPALQGAEPAERVAVNVGTWALPVAAMYAAAGALAVGKRLRGG